MGGCYCIWSEMKKEEEEEEKEEKEEEEARPHISRAAKEVLIAIYCTHVF